MSWIYQKYKLQSLAKLIDPSIKLVTKDSVFWKILAYMLYIVTFGRYKRCTFLNDSATTIGPVQAYPRNWKYGTVKRILLHESRHCKQYRWLGFGNPWAGIPLFTICYLFLPIPFYLAYIRYMLELDACKSQWKWMLKLEYTYDDVLAHAKYASYLISGKSYMYAWPKKWAREKYLECAHKVIREFIDSKDH